MTYELKKTNFRIIRFQPDVWQLRPTDIRPNDVNYGLYYTSLEELLSSKDWVVQHCVYNRPEIRAYFESPLALELSHYINTD